MGEREQRSRRVREGSAARMAADSVITWSTDDGMAAMSSSHNHRGRWSLRLDDKGEESSATVLRRRRQPISVPVTR